MLRFLYFLIWGSAGRAEPSEYHQCMSSTTMISALCQGSYFEHFLDLARSIELVIETQNYNKLFTYSERQVMNTATPHLLFGDIRTHACMGVPCT